MKLMGNPVPGRRDFIRKTTALTMSSLVLPGWLHASISPKDWTVGEIMQLFINEVPGGKLEQTVDTLKSGSADQRVTGIVTTMFATVDVIRKAIAMKANFIIAHEPTFYNHTDDTSWLEGNSVYEYKADLLRKNNIAVWRNHDYVHRLAADGVRAGVVQALGWEKYSQGGRSPMYEIPVVSLVSLIDTLKQKFGVPMIRYIGDLAQPCRRVLLMPGASGGRNQITSIEKEKPDVIVCGELAEWETAEYVRDAQSKGDKLSLVVIGHVASEEPGSIFLAGWLREKVKGVPVTHIPAGNSLQFR